MKKLLIFLILLIPFNINALDKKEVTLNKCVDGDTAWVNLKNEKIKIRFLGIDTPESTNKTEEYGKEASKFTCDKLTNASKIEIEYDNKSDKVDKYNRHLVWVFVDNKLLQGLIVKNGLAEIKYIYGDYKYLDELNNDLELAKKSELNLWSNQQYLFEFNGYKITSEILYSVVVIIVILIICIFSKSTRNKVSKKVKNKVKKNINKKIDDLF